MTQEEARRLVVEIIEIGLRFVPADRRDQLVAALLDFAEGTE